MIYSLFIIRYSFLWRAQGGSHFEGTTFITGVDLSNAYSRREWMLGPQNSTFPKCAADESSSLTSSLIKLSSVLRDS